MTEYKRKKMVRLFSIIAAVVVALGIVAGSLTAFL